MNERIKKLRKSLDLTQQEFADRIKVSRNNIASYETGKSNAGDAVISLICREFHISEEWLRYGRGPMEQPAPVSTLDQLAQEHHLTASSKALIEKFLSLDEKQQNAVSDFILAVANAINPDSSRIDELERRIAAIEEEEGNNFRGGIDAGNNVG